MPLTQQPIRSPFGAESLASEVVAGATLAGKTAIVTGGAAGLGVETAWALARVGARVIMPVRSREKGEKVAARIRAATENTAVEVADMDLADYASVRAFADSFVKSGTPLHLLINNAGIMACPERRIDGRIESQFGTNHLGHMLLACRLAPALLKGAPARVVALSSLGHRGSPIRFDDPYFEQAPYNKWMAYAQSKTANSLFAVELNRRLESKGVTAFAAHPGMIVTELGRDLTLEEIKGVVSASDGKPNAAFKTPDGGASTAVWCAVSPLLAAGGGVYCEDCNIAPTNADEDTGMVGVHRWAIDPDEACRLWAMSEDILQERFEF